MKHTPIISLIVALVVLILTGCQAIVATPSPTATSAPGFADDLATHLAALPDIPPFATVEVASLRNGEATMAFPASQGTVLQFRVSGYPDPKSTRKIVSPLIQAATTVAGRHQRSLDGIEVVFFRRDTDSPMLVWAATPPWGDQQIFSASTSGP